MPEDTAQGRGAAFDLEGQLGEVAAEVAVEGLFPLPGKGIVEAPGELTHFRDELDVRGFDAEKVAFHGRLEIEIVQVVDSAADESSGLNLSCEGDAAYLVAGIGAEIEGSGGVDEGQVSIETSSAAVKVMKLQA